MTDELAVNATYDPAPSDVFVRPPAPGGAWATAGDVAATLRRELRAALTGNGNYRSAHVDPNPLGIAIWLLEHMDGERDE